jgi:hypothetical protein
MAHRSTAGEIDDTAMQYFKVNVFFPFIISYEKYLSSLCSLVTFLQVFASIHAFTISQSAFCKA